MNNFNYYASIISPKPNYKLGAYCIYIDAPEQYEKIAFSLYGQENLEQCFLDGVYPFEDRIDIIGYFYYITENEYTKIELNSIKQEFTKMEESRGTIN